MIVALLAHWLSAMCFHFKWLITATEPGFDFTVNSPHDSALNHTTSIASSPIDAFAFYVSGAGGEGGDFFFNNLSVIPEPGTALLLVGGLGLMAWMRRRNHAISGS